MSGESSELRLQIASRSAKALSSADPPLPPPILFNYMLLPLRLLFHYRRYRGNGTRLSKKVRSRIQIIVCIFPLDSIIRDICCRSVLHAVTLQGHFLRQLTIRWRLESHSLSSCISFADALKFLHSLESPFSHWRKLARANLPT